ncbi:MAG: arginase family protein [Chloroflexi bacterium]|nr:arginase family protein [Chloroflexota bacterium]
MTLSLISVPFSQDQHLRGMGQAPGALRSAGLLARLAERGLRVARDVTLADVWGEGDMLTRLGRLQAGVADSVAQALSDGHTPVILGGDCCNAIGMWSGIARARSNLKVGVAWFDAHGDWNTEETTLSGYIGGMPYAAICGYGNAALRRDAGLTKPAATKHCALLGARDLDPPEKALLDTTTVTVLTTEQIRQSHASALHALAGADVLYLHFDVDVLDLNEAPGVNYPAPGGLSSDEAIRIARDLIAAKPLLAFTLSAVDPTLDASGKTVETGMKVLLEILANDKRET